MPGDLKKMLLARSDCTLAQLAAFADTIHSCTAKPPAVMQVESADFSAGSSGAAPDSMVPVCAVNPPQRGSAAPPRRQAASFGRGAVGTAAAGVAAAPRPGYCWYHGRFGVNARACKAGCTFPKNGFTPEQ